MGICSFIQRGKKTEDEIDDYGDEDEEDGERYEGGKGRKCLSITDKRKFAVFGLSFLTLLATLLTPIRDMIIDIGNDINANIFMAESENEVNVFEDGETTEEAEEPIKEYVGEVSEYNVNKAEIDVTQTIEEEADATDLTVTSIEEENTPTPIQHLILDRYTKSEWDLMKLYRSIDVDVTQAEEYYPFIFGDSETYGEEYTGDIGDSESMGDTYRINDTYDIDEPVILHYAAKGSGYLYIPFYYDTFSSQNLVWIVRVLNDDGDVLAQRNLYGYCEFKDRSLMNVDINYGDYYIVIDLVDKAFASTELGVGIHFAGEPYQWRSEE